MEILSLINYLEKKAKEKKLPKSEEYEIYTDGSSRSNPGPMGIGIVFKTTKHEIKKHLDLGPGTNNIAEYSALLYALLVLKNNKIKKIRAYTDSLLVEKQINREWKIKDKTLRLLASEIFDLIEDFDFEIKWIKREENKKADKLSKV